MLVRSTALSLVPNASMALFTIPPEARSITSDPMEATSDCVPSTEAGDELGDGEGHPDGHRPGEAGQRARRGER